jgi:hypothetical protein
MSNRRNRRAEAARARRQTPPDLQAGLAALNRESGGCVTLEIFRRADMARVFAAAAAGDDEASRALTALDGALAQIQDAPPHRAALCACCPRVLREGRYAFGLVLPARDDPTGALALAICDDCGTSRTEIMAKAAEALRRIWPDLRQIPAPHGPCGHA